MYMQVNNFCLIVTFHKTKVEEDFLRDMYSYNNILKNTFMALRFMM